METINRISTPLLKAFDKMIRGINIELSKEGKDYLKEYCTDRWWFIQSVNADESLNIVSSSHYVFEGIKLKYVKV
jgi:DNA phosphorothioation-dependent restriction protein DptG